TLMGYSLFAKGLKETRAGLSSIVLIVVEPFSAVVFAILFLGESLTVTSILGGSLIITSGLLLYSVNKRSNRKKKTEMVD
ncbi:MAG: EamA family transporter, partial [Candidatus Bipolaricaulota bacterium]